MKCLKSSLLGYNSWYNLYTRSNVIYSTLKSLRSWTYTPDDQNTIVLFLPVSDYQYYSLFEKKSAFTSN